MMNENANRGSVLEQLSESLRRVVGFTQLLSLEHQLVTQRLHMMVEADMLNKKRKIKLGEGNHLLYNYFMLNGVQNQQLYYRAPEK